MLKPFVVSGLRASSNPIKKVALSLTIQQFSPSSGIAYELGILPIF